MGLVEDVASLVGAGSVEELRDLILAVLAPDPTYKRSNTEDLLMAVARSSLADTGTGNTLTPEAALAAAGTLDERVQVMLSINQQLGPPQSILPNHQDLVARLYEACSSGKKEAPADQESAVLAIVRFSDDRVTEDELDQYVENGQPTRFFYETALAKLEALDEDLEDSDTVRTSATEEDNEDDDIDQAVSARVSPFQVQSLVGMVRKHKLDMVPAWQRTDVWSPKKKRELIKSLILGIPLPSIILHRREGVMSIIDGKQRLLAITQFVNNEFKLPRYDVRPESPLYNCRGAYYDHQRKPSIPDHLKTDFDLREIPALVFEDVTESLLRRIFNLYNTSGVKLTPAEIRNAVYQANPVHRALYHLAGEGTGQVDLGVGGVEVQNAFTAKFRSTYPGARRRYQGVDFLARYLGYSRAVQPDVTKPFGTPSTSKAIDNYFDHRSRDDNPATIAQELLQVYSKTPHLFDADDGSRLAYFTRNAKGKRQFNKLSATTFMVATAFLIAVMAKGLLTEEDARRLCLDTRIPVPDKQQSATIWDFQARVLIHIRDQLGTDVTNRVGGHWPDFFTRMELCILPPAAPDA